jgi:VWFA-related protein
VQAFLKSDTLPNSYVTIYRLDRGLRVVQPYTADQKLLAKAVNAAAKGVNSVSAPGTETVASALNTTIQANIANLTASPLLSPQQGEVLQNLIFNPTPTIVTDPLWSKNAAAEDASVALGAALMAQSKTETGLRFAESLSDGMDTFAALRELVRAQSKLPGRKVVLYLADGLTLPMDRRDVVNSVISYANQMEVTFYAVDSRGLSVEDPLMQSLADQQRAAGESSANKVSPRIGHAEDDDINLSTTSDKQLAMVELAESTGGFAVTNTNEIALPMQRVMEDIRTHYELAYTPSSTVYDGHFRKIQVRVTRPHVTVQTRSGYFAVPDVNGEPLQAFEMTALRAINSHPAPVDLPYQAALLRFRPKSTSVDYQVVFDVPVSNLRMARDSKTSKARVRISVVALIHNGDGKIVGKVSRELVRHLSSSDTQKLGDEYIVYAEPVELPGGHYVIDTAVTDELAERTAVKRISAFVDSGKPLGLSSLELVRGVQPLGGPRDGSNPFETDTGLVVPRLADSMAAGQPLGLYFVVYPTPTAEAEPTITLQLFRDGQQVGIKNLDPPQPQADGSIPMLLQITPDIGQCDVVITARQGTTKAEAMLSVKIKPNENSSVN